MIWSFADIITLMCLLCIVGSISAYATRRNDRHERFMLWTAAIFHLVVSQVLLFLQSTIYRQSDIWFYRELSTPMVVLMEADPLHYVPQVFLATVHLPNEFGFQQLSSTDSMITSTGLGRWLTNDSMPALFAAAAYGSFLGKWGIYAAFRDELKDVARKYVAAATLFIPSVVFWTAGVVKEAYAVLGLGALVFGMRAILARRLVGFPAFLFGAAVILLFKGFLLFPAIVGCAAWTTFALSKKVRAHPIFYLVVGIFIGIAVVAVGGLIFPSLSPASLADQTAELQQRGAMVGDEGGSYFEFTADRSLTGQLLATPLALATVLSRPFLWETRNPTSFLAGLEMAILTVLAVRALLKGKLDALGGALTVPAVLYALTFAFIGGIAVGLSTNNFGTLSRYRVPIMPFYAVAVVHLSQWAERSSRATAKERVSRGALRHWTKTRRSI